MISELAIDMLKKHQWSGVVRGDDGSVSRRCPECHGGDPSESLNCSNGNHIQGGGHLPGCLIAAAIDDGVPWTVADFVCNLPYEILPDGSTRLMEAS